MMGAADMPLTPTIPAPIAKSITINVRRIGLSLPFEVGTHAVTLELAPRLRQYALSLICASANPNHADASCRATLTRRILMFDAKCNIFMSAAVTFVSECCWVDLCAVQLRGSYA
jgi:hypothetical protein